jgi:hypothetical protein
MVERMNPMLPVSQQCRLLAVSRAAVYRKPVEVSAEDLAVMALIDRQYLARPYYGSRRMAAWLATQGHVRVLKSAVHAAKLGREEELGALRRLDEQARLLERCASGPPVEELIAGEREQSHNYGGRTVFGWAEASASQPRVGMDRFSRNGQRRY